jgi:hypothetical protein
MTWKYMVHGRDNVIKDSRGGYATKGAALEAARVQANGMKSSLGEPGGTEIFTIDAVEEKEDKNPQ